MNDMPLIISVNRRIRKSDRILRTVMGVLTVIFLLQGIMFSSGFMLPCFCMAIAFFAYGYLSKKEYEYTLDDSQIMIEKVSDLGRRVLHEIPYKEIQLVCLPDAPEAAPYKRGGTVRVTKYDYTSYAENVPYYTMIVRDGEHVVKLLLDLTPEAIAKIRRICPTVVCC